MLRGTIWPGIICERIEQKHFQYFRIRRDCEECRIEVYSTYHIYNQIRFRTGTDGCWK